jgi:pimeloyl-ACP methyl ester carboxylesterase
MNGMESALATLGTWLPGRFDQMPMRRRIMAKLEEPQFAGTPDRAKQFLDEMGGRTPVKAAAHRGLLIKSLDLRAELPKVTQPVLMVGGDRDTIVPRPCEAELEDDLPDVRRVEISPCGHFPQYTCPATLAEVMVDFLTPT